MDEVIEMSEADLEIVKLFDSLRSLQSIKEMHADRDEKVEIRGVEYDVKDLTEAMLVFKIRKFKEVADMTNPFYAKFILELEQLPGMANTIEAYSQFRADRIAAS